MASRPKRHRMEAGARQSNQAVLRGLSRVQPRLQAKLEIGSANDPLEREADQVANQVMNTAEPRSSLTAAPGQLSRKCAACEEEDNKHTLQTKPAGAAPAPGAAPGIVHQVLATPGRPLDAATRGFFEPRMGQDLSGVRIHEGAAAARSADAVNALAYTVGHQIVLGEGGASRHLLAHELAHVVQQTGGTPMALQRQEKTVGGPLDLKPDPCITLPGIGTRCGQEAVGLCEKTPSIPGCSLVCKVLGCTKKNEPKTACKPGFRAATSTDYAGQCCLGEIEGPQNCCPPERAASNPNAHCCKDDETVDPNSDTCVKSSSIPPISPDLLCPPERRTTLGICCVPPMVADGAICSFPAAPQTPTPQTPPSPTPQFGILWTDTIHFQQDHPGPGETDPAHILTPQGQQELASVQLWLTPPTDLRVRLIGHASSEGDTAYNQALATRRVQFIAPKVAGHVADPIIGDGAEAGCSQIGKGLWSCGESKADQSSANPEDRVVRVTFARNTLPTLKSP